VIVDMVIFERKRQIAKDVDDALVEKRERIVCLLSVYIKILC